MNKNLMLSCIRLLKRLKAIDLFSIEFLTHILKFRPKFIALTPIQQSKAPKN